MKKFITMFAVVAVMALGISVAKAAEETTLKGTMKCAKCSLKEQAKCQAVLVVKDGDKTVEYFLSDNAVGKAAHGAICKADKEGCTVTGTVSEKDGKKVITATKAE